MRLFSLIVFLFAFNTTSLAESLKLGAIIGLSGDGANIGEACKNGLELARNGLDPQLRDNIKVIYEDDQFKAKNAVSALNKLIGTEQIDAVMTLSSATSKAVGIIADQKGIPVLAIASDPEVVKDREYVFNLWVTPEEQVKVLFNELKTRKIKKIARIVATHDGTLALKDAFDARNNGEIEILMDEEYPVEVKDFRPFINKLKQLVEVDAIFVDLFFGQSGLFAKQSRELGLDLPLFNVETFEDPNEVKLSDGALIGHWYIQADDPEGAFLSKYQKKYPEASTYTAGNCHDAILLIAKAFQQKKTGLQMANFFRELKNFKGAMGVFSATGDNRFSLPATTKIVTKTGFKKLSANS